MRRFLYGRPVMTVGSAYSTGGTVGDAQSYTSQGAQLYGAAASVSQGNLGPLIGAATLLARDIPQGQVADIVNGAMGILQMAAQAGGVASIIPGFGTVIGAAVGAVLGAMELLANSVSQVTDTRPPYVKTTESVPLPAQPNGQPPTPALLAAGDGFFALHCYRMGYTGGYAFPGAPAGSGGPGMPTAATIGPGATAYDWDVTDDPGYDTMGLAWGTGDNRHSALAAGRFQASAFLSPPDWPATATSRGSLITSLGGPTPVNAAHALFERWCPSGTILTTFGGMKTRMNASPLFRPDPGNPFGWWLNHQLWGCAALGLSDLDVLHYFTGLQWVMSKQPDAPSAPDPQLSFLIGWLKPLVAAAPAPPAWTHINLGALHLGNVVQTPKPNHLAINPSLFHALGVVSQSPPSNPTLDAWVTYYLSSVRKG